MGVFVCLLHVPKFLARFMTHKLPVIHSCGLKLNRVPLSLLSTLLSIDLVHKNLSIRWSMKLCPPYSNRNFLPLRPKFAMDVICLRGCVRGCLCVPGSCALLLFLLITLEVREWFKLKPPCAEFENSSL